MIESLILILLEKTVTRSLLCFSAAIAFASASAAVAQRVDVRGAVFVDANGNGLRDANERGVAGVAVSNQDTVVTTDASGTFRVPRG